MDRDSSEIVACVWRIADSGEISNSPVVVTENPDRGVVWQS